MSKLNDAAYNAAMISVDVPEDAYRYLCAHAQHIMNSACHAEYI